MDFLGSILRGIYDVYHFPFYQWQGDYDRFYPPDHSGAIIAGLIIYGLSLVVVALAAYFTYERYAWHRDREPCQHCQKWTIWDSDGEFKGCLEGQPCCNDCNLQHEVDAEDIFLCPKDNTRMAKVTEGELIFDQCPKCNAVFLEDAELDTLRRWSYERGESDGSSRGLAIGVATGVAANAGN